MTKILLVEDNELNSDMLSRRLQRKGYDTVIAEDGEKAVSMARSESPSLILMDIQLPGMNGYEATRKIRSEPTTHAIPIIGLSSYAMLGDREKAMEAGCSDYTTKPVDFVGLLSKIEAILRSST